MRFTRSTCAVMLSLAAVVLPACSEHKTPRNVVVVVVDTLRADHVGVWNNARELTPQLDRLAAESFVFRRAVSPSNWTKPAVASLFTALYPGRHSAIGSHSRRQNLARLDPGFTTMAEHLKASGFQTAAFVTNPHISAAYRFDQGFDEFRQPVGDASKLLRRALSWIDTREGGDPFFLYLHLIEPHAPYDAPAAYRERFEQEGPWTDALFSGVGNPLEISLWLKQFGTFTPEFDGQLFAFDGSQMKPELLDEELLVAIQRLDPSVTRSNLLDRINLDLQGFDDPELIRRKTQLQALYAAEVNYIDAEIGRFLDELRHRHVLDETILVVTSDHGESFLEHGLWGHANSLHGEEVNIPLLIRVPVADGGALTGESVGLVSLVDVLPTIMDVLQLPLGGSLDGVSLRPLLEGESGLATTENAVFSESFMNDRDQVAVWRDHLKLVRSTTRGGVVSVVGFDLDRDSAEAIPLDMEDTLKSLLPILDDHVRGRTIDFSRPGADSELSESEVRKLKELGYE